MCWFKGVSGMTFTSVNKVLSCYMYIIYRGVIYLNTNKRNIPETPTRVYIEFIRLFHNYVKRYLCIYFLLFRIRD